MNKFTVLDHGHVELVEHMGNDLTVVNAARVYFANHKEKFEDKDVGLIKYLAEHGHWTPFAHPQITLRIKAPVSIRTQFFKHKQGFVENEISRRYVSFEPEFYHPEWRGKPTGTAKQGSEDFIEVDRGTEIGYNNALRTCIFAYNQLIEKGVAPEQARFVLPQGMYTEWYWTGSLAAYARFYEQRIDDHAQWEIREYAKHIGKIVLGLFPISWKHLTTTHK